MQRDVLALEVDGALVIIEPVSETAEELEEFSRGDLVVRKADQQIRRALDAIGSLAALVQQSVQGKCPGASEISFEFSVGFSAEGDLYVLRGSAEASAKVTVKWAPTEG